MKILVSSLTYPLPNGVTVSLNTAVDGFIEKGHEMRIVAPDYKKGQVRPEHYPIQSSLITRGIGVLIGKEERTFGINSRKEIRKIAQEFKPDAYWLHTLTWGKNAFEAEMIESKKPKVLFYHTLVEEYGRLYAGGIGAYTMRQRSKKVCNSVDSVMTPSSAMKNRLLSYGVTKPIHIIPTGIEVCPNPFKKKDLKEKFKIPNDAKVLLYVGRVSKEKNIDVLLKMMQKIEVNAVLLVVGPGDIKETQKIAENYGIKNKVIFSGGLPKDETVRIYGASDAFVFSSKSETQGLVIGEAMYAEIPVIALDSSIQKEVYPESTALVVRDEGSFAEKVDLCFKNKKKTTEMVKRAREFVEKNFSKKTMIRKQIKVFKDLI
jgi:1,2-diacylglycerol 3-alpha-glucosyltransferase